MLINYALGKLKCSETGIMCSKQFMIEGNYSKPILLQVIILCS